MSAAAAIRGRNGISPKVWREVLGDHTFVAFCHYCGFVASEVDHVIPRSRGGSDTPENLVAACRECNAEKSDLTPDEWAAKRREHGKPWPIPGFVERLKFLLECGIRPRYTIAGGRMRTANGELYEWFRGLLVAARDVHIAGLLLAGGSESCSAATVSPPTVRKPRASRSGADA